MASKEKKAAFLLYYDYEEIFKSLSPEDCTAILLALFAYDKRGELPNFSGYLSVIFLQFKNHLDRGRETFNERREDRRSETSAANGRLGGRPPKVPKTEAENNLNKPILEPILEPKNNLNKPILKESTKEKTMMISEARQSNETISDDDTARATVRAMFSSSSVPFIVMDEPLKYALDDYVKVCEKWLASPYIQARSKTLSKVHEFWDKLLAGVYDPREEWDTEIMREGNPNFVSRNLTADELKEMFTLLSDDEL
jgi:hypothetical protein